RSRTALAIKIAELEIRGEPRKASTLAAANGVALVVMRLTRSVSPNAANRLSTAVFKPVSSLLIITATPATRDSYGTARRRMYHNNGGNPGSTGIAETASPQAACQALVWAFAASARAIAAASRLAASIAFAFRFATNAASIRAGGRRMPWLGS